MIGKLFRRGLMVRDFEDHRMHRRVMQVAFRAEAMNGYATMMSDLVARKLGELAGGEVRDLYAVLKRLTLDVAAEVFVGATLGVEAERINRAFIDTVAAAVSPIRRELPGSAFRRGMNARRFLVSYFREQIPERRSSERSDLFTRLCHATDENGEGFNDQDIIDHMIFLLMAAHDTTTSALGTLTWELSRQPDLQAAVRRELLEGGPFDAERRNEHPLAEQAFQEALRMHPPVPFIPRRVVRDTEVGGFALPAGTLVVVAGLLIHRNPELWSTPERFDPARFSPERAEHRRHSHAYVPFSGGAHTCIGNHFAGMMTKVILQELLRRFRLVAKPGQKVRMLTLPIPKPAGGLPLLLELLAA
ncbi:MAG: cytochrome P450 [Myxococcota bacterium]